MDVRARLRGVPAPGRAPRNRGNEISGGEQQMLAVARALVTNPRLLLRDEPLEGQAPIFVEELLGVMRTLVRYDGLGLIVVEHHTLKVLGLADRVVVLKREKEVLRRNLGGAGGRQSRMACLTAVVKYAERPRHHWRGLFLRLWRSPNYFFLPGPFVSSWLSADPARVRTCFGVGVFRPARTPLASVETRGLVCLGGFFGMICLLRLCRGSGRNPWIPLYSCPCARALAPAPGGNR